MTEHDAFRIATDPNTVQSTLELLSRSKDDVIRAAVAANPSASQSTLLSLVGDRSVHVIENLRKNPTKLQENIVITLCKNITLTLAEESDAPFILSLRTNDTLNQHISSVSGSLTDQQQYLTTYKKRERNKAEFYFIIKSSIDNSPIGTVRLYDFQNGSFCWGSWIISPSSSIRTAAIESALSVYEFAFNTLKFSQAHFDVRNENKKVIAFHKRMGAEIQREDNENKHFIYPYRAYKHIRNKYNRFMI